MNIRKRLIFLLILLTPHFASFGQKKGPERFEEAIQKFEQMDKENPPQEGAILLVGSSSFTIWKDVGDYFPNQKLINRGFGGSHFSDVIYFADRVIFPYKPSKIFIYEGDNDVASGDSPKVIMKDVKMLREMIRKELPGVPVVFLSAKPSIRRSHLKKDFKKFNKKLEKWAQKEDLTMFADVYSAMVDEDGNVYNDIFLEDDLHMNAKGYEIWKTVLTPFMAGNKKD